MKVWARYAAPVRVLVDEAQDTIERVVMVPGERFIDRDLGRHAAAPELGRTRTSLADLK